MRKNLCLLRKALPIILLACAWTTLSADIVRGDTAPSKNVITVTAHPRNNRGKLGCLLFKRSKGFPNKAKRASRRAWTRIKKRQAVCHFTNVAPGHYAISILHDENNNNKLDTNFFGIPKEEYGASNDAPPGTFSGPKFSKAKFRHDGRTKAMTLKLRY